MPEHVHLLLNEPKQTKLSDIFRALKTETSKRLRGDRPRFWQFRYHDFNVFTQAKFIEKLRYIHRNPIDRGLVGEPEDWAWSSYRHWQTGETAPSKSNRTGRGPNAREASVTAKPYHAPMQPRRTNRLAILFGETYDNPSFE